MSTKFDLSRSAWVTTALSILADDHHRCPAMQLRIFPLPEQWGIDLYLADESAHLSGSLKHRLARSLFINGLVSGEIDSETILVEASSGSTAVSEAYFAHLLGLSFVAVVPSHTSPAKLRLIESHGGSCRLTDDAASASSVAAELGALDGWYFLDQFSRASAVTDWRSGNIASDIFDRLQFERYPDPDWIVVGAGTGGTSATVGRYCRSTARSARLAVVDPEGSAYFEAWSTGNRNACGTGSRIEGIGRSQVEISFVPSVIDQVLVISDNDSIAASQLLVSRTGLSGGPSTGTNLAGALRLVDQMRTEGVRGSVVTLICDSGDRYLDTFGDPLWLDEAGIDPRAAYSEFERMLALP